jgi:hypothetical protein
VKRRQHGYGQHLLDGLGILWSRWAGPIRKWRTGGTRPGDTTVRTVLLAGIALGAAGVLRSSWRLLLAVALVLAVVALRTATKARKPAPPKQAADVAEQPPADDDSEQLPEVTPAAFLALVHTVIGTARGVHLVTLANALSARLGGAWEVADVRRLCQAAGQPTRPVVRAPGRGPTVGIHREDLQPLPQHPGQGLGGAVVVAGQDATTRPTTAPATTPTTPAVATIGGVRIATTPDPDNPHRHAVTVTELRRTRRP